MQTFEEIRQHLIKDYLVVHDEPFMLGLELTEPNSGRRQSVFVAELKGGDGRRFLRVETTIAPLGDHDPEKCLRVNLMLRVGYLAVGDLEGVPFLKMCENLGYAGLTDEWLDYIIQRVAGQGDGIENTLTEGEDWF